MRNTSKEKHNKVRSKTTKKVTQYFFLAEETENEMLCFRAPSPAPRPPPPVFASLFGMRTGEY
jgi:hypothetical protein